MYQLRQILCTVRLRYPYKRDVVANESYRKADYEICVSIAWDLIEQRSGFLMELLQVYIMLFAIRMVTRREAREQIMKKEEAMKQGLSVHNAFRTKGENLI